MQRFVIERALPDIGSAERAELRGAAAQSTGVLQARQADGKSIQWDHSYVAGDKTFCIHVADDAALIDDPAERTGFPATIVTPVGNMIDPTTANA